MYCKNENMIWLATGESKVMLLPSMANRHGLIAGATGTGKTVSLKVLAESFSDMGVPVFLADIKGDVTGICRAGEPNKHVDERVASMKITDFAYRDYPVRFFDVFGKKGLPVRTTVSEIGPDLLSRLLAFNETQSGILNIIFKIADDQGLLLLDLKDLQAMVRHVGEHSADYRTAYGNIATQSVGAIQRALLRLDDEGAAAFFGEPSLDINDWLAVDQNARGYINILECAELVENPLLYSTCLLWLLSELYEGLPEVGDPQKPKIVFFFDEAHLLFRDAPKALLQKVEQVVRLIRSKGVGVYFITQQPSDIPDTVLSQLGNKVQHALRAYTPNDQKALRAAASSFRTNPNFSCEKVLQELGTGEALVSVLDAQGVPTVVERAFILPPQSYMSAADDATRDSMIKSCSLYAKYSQPIDRESAYEDIEKQAQEQLEAQQQAAQEAAKEKEKEQELKEREREQRLKEREHKLRHPHRKSSFARAVDTTMNTIGRELGRNIARGLLGSLIKR